MFTSHFELTPALRLMHFTKRRLQLAGGIMARPGYVRIITPTIMAPLCWTPMGIMLKLCVMRQPDNKRRE